MDLENALNVFVKMLPDYFPKDLGNPNDLHRWMEVCYFSCVCDSSLNKEDVEKLLQNRFSDYSGDDIHEAASNYMQNYYSYSTILDFLKRKGLLVVTKSQR